jgi:hypothetical protein
VGTKELHKKKQELETQLKRLNDRLNEYLARQYGIDKYEDLGGNDGLFPKDNTLKQTTKRYDKWLASHKPFHWFAEFYQIMHKGGFDVVIGNPPYVEYKDVCKFYKLLNFNTTDCSNLFAYVLERCSNLVPVSSQIGMIIPLSAFSTDRMIPLINLIKSQSSIIRIANFGWRPGKLFDGVNLQLSILLQKTGSPLSLIETTRYILWDSEARKELFSKIEYSSSMDDRLPGCIPKLGSAIATSILKKIRNKKEEIGLCFTHKSKNNVYYRRGGLYWKVFVDFETGSSEEKIINVLPDIKKHAIIATLSSDLWWWYFTITSDCRHLGNRDIATFPFNPTKMAPRQYENLAELGKQYVKELKGNAEKAIRVYKKTKEVECLSFRVNQSKPIIDQIDALLARHYGFTDEELDYIINYDIKYRMGGELEGEEDEE